ncbi:hypothetical protein IEI94_12050 [Halomonas sp. ML-15]|uniref:hypothetical protein n=1 Tax=Halomonas sp. ML-15 TaxID=2773305 RepID=UPI0017463861|nr:hypothetical protein [Halomonas sp. ML-15]MBD3896583.1 hypothetical protein [Halomonas sp. ML-15]
MPRKNKRPKAAPSKPSSRPAARKRPFSPKRLIRGLLVAVAIIAVPAAWFAMEARQAREVSDLSVIGGGEPVVVQVHEPGCTSCEQLLEQAQEARSRLDEELILRRANIASSSGRRFAYEYGVSQSTLVLFDARGEVVEVKRGVVAADELEADFVALQSLPRPRRR